MHNVVTETESTEWEVRPDGYGGLQHGEMRPNQDGAETEPHLEKLPGIQPDSANLSEDRRTQTTRNTGQIQDSKWGGVAGT